MLCRLTQSAYLCGVVKMLPPRQRYEKGVRLTNFRTIEYARSERNKENDQRGDT